MDNFHFDMTSEGEDALKKALALFSPPGNRVVGYSVDDKRMLLPHAHGLPFAMPLDMAADFASKWLESADYGEPPDIDGDCSRGWRLYCESWGQVGDDPYAFAAIEPAWAMHGK